MRTIDTRRHRRTLVRRHPMFQIAPHRRPRRLIGAAVIAFWVFPLSLGAQLPRTGAETAEFSRTTSHQELLDFLYDVQARTDRMRISHLTTTDEGRMMPLVMLGAPVVTSPVAAM